MTLSKKGKKLISTCSYCGCEEGEGWVDPIDIDYVVVTCASCRKRVAKKFPAGYRAFYDAQEPVKLSC